MAATQTRVLLAVVLALAMIAGPARGCDLRLGIGSATQMAEDGAPMSGDCEGCPETDGTASKICFAACVNASLVPPSEDFAAFDYCRETFVLAGPESLVGKPIRPDPHPPKSVGLG